MSFQFPISRNVPIENSFLNRLNQAISKSNASTDHSFILSGLNKGEDVCGWVYNDEPFPNYEPCYKLFPQHEFFHLDEDLRDY